MADFMTSVGKLVETVSEALEGPVVPAVIAIGKDVVELLKSSKDVVGNNNGEELETMLQDLEPKVMAHAERTEAELRGE